MPLSRPVPYEPIWFQESTVLNVDTLDTMDYGVLNSFYQTEAMWLVDDSEEVITYDINDNITDIKLYEAASTTPVLRRHMAIGYTGDDITTLDMKVYEDDGTTLFLHYTDTLTYTSGNLTKTARTVTVMPTGGV